MGSDVNPSDLSVHDLQGGRKNLRLGSLDVHLQQVDAIERRQYVPQRDRRDELDFAAQAEAEVAHDSGRIVQQDVLEHAFVRAIPPQQVDGSTAKRRRVDL